MHPNEMKYPGIPTRIMTKFYALALLTLFITSCSHKKLPVKKIEEGGVTVFWYRTSDLTNTHAYVEVTENDRTTVVLNYRDGAITDIDYDFGDIVIKIISPENINKKDFLNKVGRHQVRLVAATQNEYFKHYQPEYYKR